MIGNESQAYLEFAQSVWETDWGYKSDKLSLHLISS